MGGEFRLLVEIQQFDLAELHGVAFALERDPALAEERAILFHGGVVVADVAAANLRLLILEDELAVDVVLNGITAIDTDFDADPLFAVEGVGSGVEAVG